MSETTLGEGAMATAPSAEAAVVLAGSDLDFQCQSDEEEQGTNHAAVMSTRQRLLSRGLLGSPKKQAHTAKKMALSESTS